MELVWKQLIMALGSLAELAEELGRLALETQSAIRQEKIKKIGELVIEQEKQFLRFQMLDQEREALVRELGSQLGIAAGARQAEKLAERVPPAWSNEYRLGIERLRRAVKEVKTTHAVNQKLLQHAQAFMGWLLNYLATPEGGTPMYNQDGQQHQDGYCHFVHQML